MILKLGTKLDSDDLYCVAKNSHILLICPFIGSFSFSPMEISVIDFSAPIGASVLKVCALLCTPSGIKLYCVNKIKMLILTFAFFFSFFLNFFLLSL